MTALLLIAAASLGTVLAHALLLRHLPTGWVFRAIPLFLFCAIGLVFLICRFAEWPVNLVIVTQVVVISASITFCYALTLVGVVHDSPTLALINTIELFGINGMPEHEFTSFINDHPFASSRIAALIAAGEVEEQDGGVLRLRGNASALLAVGDVYRWLRGNRIEGTG